jgi:hypothetical protein
MKPPASTFMRGDATGERRNEWLTFITRNRALGALISWEPFVDVAAYLLI